MSIDRPACRSAVPYKPAGAYPPRAEWTASLPSSRERRAAGIASSAACWFAYSVSPPRRGIVIPYRQVPAGGRAWKLQSVCQFSANSGDVSSASRLIAITCSASLDRSDERVVTERSEVQREPFQVVVGHRLAGEREDVVLEPCGTDLGDRRIVEWAAEVDAGDRGTARLTRWPNLDPHRREPYDTVTRNR